MVLAPLPRWLGFVHAIAIAVSIWYAAVIQPFMSEKTLSFPGAIQVMDIGVSGILVIVIGLETVMDAVALFCIHCCCNRCAYNTSIAMGMEERPNIKRIWAVLCWIGAIFNAVAAFAARVPILLAWIAVWHLTATVILFTDAAWCYTRLDLPNKLRKEVLSDVEPENTSR